LSAKLTKTHSFRLSFLEISPTGLGQKISHEPKITLKELYWKLWKCFGILKKI